MKKKIMVVDDDKMILMMCEFILTKEGYEVVTVESGKRCLEYLRDESNPNIDCILLDIEMPLLDGFKTLSSIRHSEKLMKIPVMFLTATATPDTVKEAIRLGVTSYLKKPFLPNELTERVAQLLDDAKK
ncbi:MAG: response regulator transcription factor [[Eubacterium] saphenum]|nr:response regulator transcription factor [[Eubacterium] saphenum]